jgi:hypothetical protein
MSKQAKYIVQLQHRLLESQRKCLLLYQQQQSQEHKSGYKADYDESTEMVQMKSEMEVILQENKILTQRNEEHLREIQRLSGIIKRGIRSRSPQPK